MSAPTDRVLHTSGTCSVCDLWYKNGETAVLPEHEPFDGVPERVECPTNHKTQLMPMRGELFIVPTPWPEIHPQMTFCPDCGQSLKGAVG